MLRARAVRRGEGELGGLAGLLVVGALVWFFLLRPEGGGGVSGRGALAEPPRAVVVGSQHDYRAFGDSNRVVTVRNVGGDGRIKVTVEAYRDQEGTRLIDRWSTVLYLTRGEEKTATIVLRGLSEGAGCSIRTTAAAE